MNPLTEFKLSLYINGLAVAYRYHNAHMDFRKISNVKMFLRWLKDYGYPRKIKTYESDISYLQHYIATLGGRKSMAGFTQRSMKEGYLAHRGVYLRDYSPPNFKELVVSTYFVVDIDSGKFLRGFTHMANLNKELGVTQKKKLDEGVVAVSSKKFDKNFLVVNSKKANLNLFNPFDWEEYVGLSLEGVLPVSDVLKEEI